MTTTKRKRDLVAAARSMDPKPGDVVQHYKGELYVVLMLARDEVTGEPLVVYTKCAPPKRGKSEAWVRRWADWISRPLPGVDRYRNLALVDAARSRSTEGR